ncbi:MAG: glycosyltransferase family A protein [Eubacteriales bacterium]|nr:glycosyltransferase family A protein [Eubacteriales bacterium]
MASITVFTPTYNRAYILGKCYDSLNAQTCKDFEWLIIDDGSTDHTRELVSEWMKQSNGYTIRYIYKENGGLHTGYNTAIANMDTELSVCIDSDDSLPMDGIERILAAWRNRKNKDAAGLVGLDYDKNGELIGKRLPDAETINAAALLCVPGQGDKKYVMRNDLWKKAAPMPVFSGEKNFNPHYFIIKLSRQYRFIPVNECFCIVDYQENGMSANIYKQYVDSPNSFAELRKAVLEVPGMTFGYRYKTAAHYICESWLAKRKIMIVRSPLLLAALPLAIVYYIYIQRMTR